MVEWAGLPAMGGTVWPFRRSCHLAPALHRNIATIAIFYALPVVQLVITYQTVSSGGWLPGLCRAAGSPSPQTGTSQVQSFPAWGCGASWGLRSHTWAPIPALP